MPCYSPWNEYLELGTPQFEQAKAVVVAKLRAVTHIIDYYYQSHGLQLPALAEGTVIDSHRQPRSLREFALREMICHHFSCDGVDFCSLYDVASLLSPQVEKERAYLAVVLPCATLMRTHKERFAPSRRAEDRLDF
ncbi:hypothetical protein INQ48_35040 (plasmid) [Variovorax paradoxus]|jgi:hypothetical protein|uniref:hypothetical protein n=1 Tax=Variovorax sp. UC122_21 TaxID=3374554 RepID=UPI0019335A87|nr:hypothetical protein INQ48_35040 [Variovorax paradoxus]